MNIFYIILNTISLVVLIGIGIFIIFCLQAILVRVPFVPTKKNIMLKMIKIANLEKDDIVYDLGSGDGRFVIEAAKTGVKMAVGFETSYILNWYARIRSRFYKLKNTEFRTESLLKADFTKCTKIFVYLLEFKMKEIEQKIKSEAQNGLIIISNTFQFSDLKPIQIFEKEKIYIYQIKKDL